MHGLHKLKAIGLHASQVSAAENDRPWGLSSWRCIVWMCGSSSCCCCTFVAVVAAINGKAYLLSALLAERAVLHGRKCK